MAPELKHHLDRVLAAIKAVDAGPSPDELAHAPFLDAWRPLVSIFGSPVLRGRVGGHPRLGSAMITTSRLIAIDREAGRARSLNRWFRLGRAAESDADPGRRIIIAEVKRGLIIRETGAFFPVDDPAVLDGILAGFIAAAREATRRRCHVAARQGATARRRSSAMPRSVSPFGEGPVRATAPACAARPACR